MCPPTAVRRGSRLVFAQVSFLVLASLSGYLLGLAPALGFAADNAQAGRLDAAVALSGISLMVGFVSLGYMLGCLLPRTAAPLAAAAIAFAATVLSGVNGTASSPVWPFGVVEGLEETPIVSWYRVMFFLGAAVVLLVGATKVLERRAILGVPKLGLMLIGTLTPIVLVANLANGDAPPLVRQSASVPVCANRDSVTVCVHAARAVLLPRLTSLARELSTALGAAAPARLSVDDALLWSHTPGTLVIEIQGQSASGWASAALVDMATQLTGAATCSSHAPLSNSGPSLSEPARISQGVANWLVSEVSGRTSSVSSDPGAVRVARRLATSPTAAVQVKLAGSLPRIQACRGQDSDLSIR
jgi:hypothetical protein